MATVEGLASRSDVERLVRPYLPAIAAIAIAADDAALRVTRAAITDPQAMGRYVPKMRGNKTAVLWSEAVREWVQTTRPPGVQVYAPHSWVELILHDKLHVRIQKDRTRPSSPRRMRRGQQLRDPGIPLWMLPEPATAVDIQTVYSDVSNSIVGVSVVAPWSGQGQLWDPINFPLAQARRQLASWRRRPAQVPWMKVIETHIAMAASVPLRARIGSEQSLEAGRNVVDLSELASDAQDQRATFRPRHPKTDEAEGPAPS